MQSLARLRNGDASDHQRFCVFDSALAAGAAFGFAQRDREKELRASSSSPPTGKVRPRWTLAQVAHTPFCRGGNVKEQCGLRGLDHYWISGRCSLGSVRQGGRGCAALDLGELAERDGSGTVALRPAWKSKLPGQPDRHERVVAHSGGWRACRRARNPRRLVSTEGRRLVLGQDALPWAGESPTVQIKPSSRTRRRQTRHRPAVSRRRQTTHDFRLYRSLPRQLSLPLQHHSKRGSVRRPQRLQPRRWVCASLLHGRHLRR